MFHLYFPNRTQFFFRLYLCFIVVLICTEFSQKVASRNAFSELGSKQTSLDHQREYTIPLHEDSEHDEDDVSAVTSSAGHYGEKRKQKVNKNQRQKRRHRGSRSKGRRK